MEGPKDRRAVVVTREIGPGRNRRIDSNGAGKKSSSRQGEDEVAQNGGQPLEPGVYFIQYACSEWASCRDGVVVRGDEGSNLVACGIVKEDGTQVVNKLRRGAGGVGLKQAE